MISNSTEVEAGVTDSIAAAGPLNHRSHGTSFPLTWRPSPLPLHQPPALLRTPENEDEEYDLQEHQEKEIKEADEEEIEVGESCEFLKKEWPLMNAWKIQSRKLTTKVAQIERGLRLMCR
ncbi:hypothetical protein L2E82_33719 [Cichorium intybus]|uniref:Uncharacterized protein n=1 Tax=Cichorium intybus TaxID=13427 RepID=A0ACB9BL22_CICIN|nr:hypothetical protein L2E82_33719 [Cichorium intybus]